jgi:hypothetical protein
MNRRRGSFSWRNYFAVRKDSKGIAWYIEPVSEICSSVQDVIKTHSMSDGEILFGKKDKSDRLQAIGTIRI